MTLTEARRFVAEHHRHNGPGVTWKFGVGVETDDGELVGVAMAGLPKARMLMEQRTLEVNRTCTTGEPNANSMLYGAIARAAKALGYDRLITYTLVSEPGSSLKASGWVVDAEVPGDESWQRRSGIPQTDLFGDVRNPVGPKIRWIRWLAQPETPKP